MNVVLNVNFVGADQNIHTVLAMKDMCEADLDISIQGCHVSSGSGLHLFVMEIGFLIHGCSPSNVTLEFYTEQEFRAMHHTLQYLSANALEMLLCLANGNFLDSKTLRTTEKMKDGCKMGRQIVARLGSFKLTVGSQEPNLAILYRLTSFLSVDGQFVLWSTKQHVSVRRQLFEIKQKILKVIQHMWCLSYTGPPDYLVVDQGSVYIIRKESNKLLRPFELV